MKNIRIVSMDFDGTLLTSNKKISDRTRKCLIEFKNKSYFIIGVTARNLLSVKNILDVSLFDYIILNNGSDIYYVGNDKVENVSNVTKETAKKIYNSFSDKCNQIDFCTPFKYLIKSKEKRDDRPFIKYINGLEEVNDSISRMNVFFEDDKKLNSSRKWIEKTFDDINVVKMIDTDKLNSRMWLTINPKNTNKLSTLEKICKDLGCSIDDVVFFGDGENDLVLIENVGTGVAMENAIDIVKEKAKFVTLSNDNDGIAEFLENNL
jgi:Cof subfamily protein (haloacid dehalogenase superfamily)